MYKINLVNFRFKRATNKSELNIGKNGSKLELGENKIRSPVHDSDLLKLQKILDDVKLSKDKSL